VLPPKVNVARSNNILRADLVLYGYALEVIALELLAGEFGCLLVQTSEAPPSSRTRLAARRCCARVSRFGGGASNRTR
jgi:hypothetical protein